MFLFLFANFVTKMDVDETDKTDKLIVRHGYVTDEWLLFKIFQCEQTVYKLIYNFFVCEPMYKKS